MLLTMARPFLGPAGKILEEWLEQLTRAREKLALVIEQMGEKYFPSDTVFVEPLKSILLVLTAHAAELAKVVRVLREKS